MVTTILNNNRSTGQSFLLSKIASLKARTELLTGLERVATTKNFRNISSDQWYAINSQLNNIASKILVRINACSGKYFSQQANEHVKKDIVNELGEIELELNEAYTFYDTYMDLLTQRLSPVLGPLLCGCDVIAADGLKHGHLETLTNAPIVYCNYGFGASIVRQEMRIARTANPVSFIAIPYSRLAEKYNLISIYHEVGHLALNKLNLIGAFQEVFSVAIKNAGGNKMMQGLFSNWSKELVPDFWAFAHTGIGQTSSMRDVLLVPQTMAFQISPYQQHPPPYLRFLFSVEWCRFLWGRGEWDEWQKEWEAFYPVEKLDKVTKETILCAKALLPAAARATISTKFKYLNGKPLTSLFKMNALSPYNLNTMVRSKGLKDMSLQPIGVQLAYFRLLRDNGKMSLQEINSLIRKWLTNLGKQQNINNN